MNSACVVMMDEKLEKIVFPFRSQINKLSSVVVFFPSRFDINLALAVAVENLGKVSSIKHHQ